jgi:NADPH2:quinone reductase
MKAVVCEAFGGPETLALRDIPDPPPPEQGEIQVDIKAHGVQYVDVLMLAGKYQFRPDPPFIPGAEVAGIVAAVGAGVTHFRPGESVMSWGRIGGFAELRNCDAMLCDHIPSGMRMDTAASFRRSFATAYHALVQRGRIKTGEWVLIHGAAGGIGLAAVQIAKLFGANVIATASSPEKRAACLKQGADFAIEYQHGFIDQVKEITHNNRLDIVYDTIGGRVTEESIRCLAWGGRLLILGFLGGQPASIRSNYLLIKGIEAIGIGGLNEADPALVIANMKTVTELAGSGRVKPHVSHRFGLAEATDAISALIDRKVIGKAVLLS